MTNFKKKIFGANIDYPIQDKLIARQHVAEFGFGQSANTITGSQGNTIDVSQKLQLEKNLSAKVSELGSRTPWARAWVAIELYHVSNKHAAYASVEETKSDHWLWGSLGAQEYRIIEHDASDGDFETFERF